MSEIILRLPAKTQYGYVEIKATPEELGLEDLSDAHAIGVAYACVQALFREGEAKGLRLANGTPVPPSRPVKAPPAVDYDALEEEEAARLLKEELGAKEVEYKVGDKVTVGGIEFTKHSEVPWENSVAPKPKPWETGAAAAKAAAIEDLFA